MHLVGHLGRDAETKFTPAGVAVTKFSVATNRRWKDQQSSEWKEETDWTNVVLWRQENLANYLTKGKQVYVEGRLQTRSYDDKDGKKSIYDRSCRRRCDPAGGRTRREWRHCTAGFTCDGYQCGAQKQVCSYAGG